jgi:hypothetical protein
MHVEDGRHVMSIIKRPRNASNALIEVGILEDMVGLED